ncbi:unnamed protein product [Durusdinium trenchii]|uniref:Uncharacterized protein n=1 Tax=Durusdinium trenchii TaxID=1381693 RepID=A0ABP0KVQ6_9DINO
MPVLNDWCEQTLIDVPECRECDDHCVILRVNLASQGILTTHKREWTIAYLANALSKYKKNGIAILIHGNRAGQAVPGRGSGEMWRKTPKDEEDEKCGVDGMEKKEEPSDGSDDSNNEEKLSMEDVEALAAKELGLHCRPLTLVFDQVTQPEWPIFAAELTPPGQSSDRRAGNETGFPDFGPIVSALRNRTTDVVEKNNYKVCKLVDSQKLAVLQVYAQRWLDEDMTKEQATQIITEHNAKFNQDGDFLQGPKVQEEPAAKRIKIEESETCAEAEITKLVGPKLLIDLEDSGEAVCFFVFSVICRRIADYVIVNLKVSHHSYNGTSEEKVLLPEKPLCFLLDERKENQDDKNENKKKKKNKAKKKDQPAAPTFKNFGALLNVPKLKGASKVVIGWRLRPDHSNKKSTMSFLSRPLCLFYPKHMSGWSVPMAPRL